MVTALLELDATRIFQYWGAQNHYFEPDKTVKPDQKLCEPKLIPVICKSYYNFHTTMKTFQEEWDLLRIYGSFESSRTKNINKNVFQYPSGHKT